MIKVGHIKPFYQRAPKLGHRIPKKPEVQKPQGLEQTASKEEQPKIRGTSLKTILLATSLALSPYPAHANPNDSYYVLTNSESSAHYTTIYHDLK